jgi:glycosyltransferase involved in cell wall biosynthesis
MKYRGVTVDKNLDRVEGAEILFSVIIPTLNEERNLKVCLDSLNRQTRRDFEVLIMDGGSRDATEEIARQYGLELILVPKKRPHDVSGARNEGIRRSRGAYIFFLDADISVDTNCLNVFENEFNQGAIGVCLKVLPYGGHWLEKSMFEFNNALCWLSSKTHIYQLSYFSCHCYRREYVMAVGGFREDLNSCEDMDLSIRISLMGKFVFSFKSTLLTSPRRVRQWSHSGYVLKYLKFLLQYYLLNNINEFYDDIEEQVTGIVDEIKISRGS